MTTTLMSQATLRSRATPMSQATLTGQATPRTSRDGVSSEGVLWLEEVGASHPAVFLHPLFTQQRRRVVLRSSPLAGSSGTPLNRTVPAPDPYKPGEWGVPCAEGPQGK